MTENTKTETGTKEGTFEALIAELASRLPQIGSCSIDVFHTKDGWSCEITRFDEPPPPTS
jgi:hypothetical protein